MRTFDEALTASIGRPPFSNGTELYAWMDNWCYRPCMVDKPWQDYEQDRGPHADSCPLILLVIGHGRTPSEWMEQPLTNGLQTLGDQYHCIEFRGEDDGPGEPQPIPDPPGQYTLLPREPYEGVRMLKPRHRRTPRGTVSVPLPAWETTQ